MRKRRRVALVGLALLAVLFLLGTVILPPLVRPVVEQAAQSRGVDLDIGSLTVGPLRGRVAMGDVVVGNSPGYAGDTLASVDACAVNAALLPLLRGDLAVRSVAVVKPKLNLERTVGGDINLFALLDQVTGPGETGEDPAAEAPEPGEEPTAFRLDRVRVDDMRVRWTDYAAPGGTTEIVLENMDVTVRDLYTPMPSDRQDTVLRLIGRLGGDATGAVRVEGTGNFLGDAVSFDMTITLDDVALTAFNGYAGRSPLRPSAGVATGTVEATCRNNQVDARAKLTLTGVSLVPNRESGLAMQLPGTVLSTVGNLDPNHEVEVHISGDIRDPQFHVVSAVMLAVVSDVANLGDLAGQLTGGTAQGLAGKGGEALRQAGEAVGSLIDRLPFGGGN